jgi:hypothetical protein
MRVNVYAEEMTDRIEIVEKVIDGVKFTGLRMYMYLPVTMYPGSPAQVQHKGPFIHGEGDDDSAAITFWGKTDLRETLWKALEILNKHYTDSGCKIESVHTPRE